MTTTQLQKSASFLFFKLLPTLSVCLPEMAFPSNLYVHFLRHLMLGFEMRISCINECTHDEELMTVGIFVFTKFYLVTPPLHEVVTFEFTFSPLFHIPHMSTMAKPHEGDILMAYIGLFAASLLHACRPSVKCFWRGRIFLTAGVLNW